VAETEGLDEVGVPAGAEVAGGGRPASDLPPPPNGTNVGLGGSAGADDDGEPDGSRVGGLNARGVNWTPACPPMTLAPCCWGATGNAVLWAGGFTGDSGISFGRSNSTFSSVVVAWWLTVEIAFTLLPLSSRVSTTSIENSRSKYSSTIVELRVRTG
jgi:hypothetical protein